MTASRTLEPHVSLRALALCTLAFTALNSHAQAGKNCASLDPATLGPKTVIGQGPNGEKAASVEQLQLAPDEIARLKAGKFKVGITMQTVNLDWSQLQVQGITDTLKKYGVEVIGVTSAEYQTDKQIADI